MSVYVPDRWSILKFNYEEKVIYKVLAGWYGGFTGSNSWKLNSGITKIKKVDNYWDVYGYSGSIYRLYEGSEGMSSLMASVFHSFETQLSDKASVSVVDIRQIELEFSDATN